MTAHPALETITTISPITSGPLLTRSAPSSSELTDLLNRSTDAFRAFSASTDLATRKSIVLDALDRLASKRDELARELTEFMGRPIRFTGKEIDTAVERGRYMVSIADEALADTPGTKEYGFDRFVSKVPVGPVLIIFAWNYPYLILINALVPALLAGNSVILKPSPQTPTVAERIASIFESVPGLPKHLVQFFHTGCPGLVEQAVQDSNVKLVCFTGSVSGGLAIQRAAAGATSFAPPRVAVRVGLELGGNDPAYVRADIGLPGPNSSGTDRDEEDDDDERANKRIAWAASQIVDGAIFNSGQSCCSVERVYVHESVYDRFVDAVVTELLDNYHLGDPRNQETNLGPVVSVHAARRIRGQIAEAVANGAVDVLAQALAAADGFGNGNGDGNASFAKVVAAQAKNITYNNSNSGSRSDASADADATSNNDNHRNVTNINSTFVVPAVLTNVTSEMAVMREETFGPVIPIMKVSSDEEAIRLMNDSDLGLTASIWTADVVSGRKIADQVEAGTVFVNRCDFPSPDLAWTGWKNSGQGQTLSKHGFDQFVKLKSYHIKNFPAGL